MKRKYSIQIEEDAKNDIAESYEWYRNILPSLAEDFLDQIENSLKYLEHNPLQFQLVYKDFRQVSLYQFPYVLLYKIENLSVKIYRVFPTKSNPDFKY